MLSATFHIFMADSPKLLLFYQSPDSVYSVYCRTWDCRYRHCIFIHQKDKVTQQTCPDYCQRPRLITSICLGLFPDPIGLEPWSTITKAKSTFVHDVTFVTTYNTYTNTQGYDKHERRRPYPSGVHLWHTANTRTDLPMHKFKLYYTRTYSTV